MYIQFFLFSVVRKRYCICLTRGNELKIVLIQPPISQRKLESLTPPLGLLVLASIFEQEECDVSIIDLNLEGYRRPGFLNPATFYEESVQRVMQEKPDVVGFTSMVIEAHVCLELARKIKQTRSEVITLFGGAHFASIATRLIDSFDFVDFVITGDGELPARSFARSLKDPSQPWSEENIERRITTGMKVEFVSTGTDALAVSPDNQVLKDPEHHWSVANIAYRTADGAKVDRRQAIYSDPDELPFPAYHLINIEEYFSLNQNRLLCLEDSRGCQLKCTFCYSPAHWGHGERRKSIDRTLVEMRNIKELGARQIFFVGDNLLTSPDGTIELCNAIIASKIKVRWNCYGTLAQLRPEVIDAMGKANCVGVFIGVDAVDPNLQKQFNKHYFKGWSRLENTLNRCLTAGIIPTCAFMVSNLDDYEHVHQTLDIAVRTKLLGCDITVNLLATYPESTQSDIHTNIFDGGTELRAKLLYDAPPLLAYNKFADSFPEFFPLHNVTAPAHATLNSIIKSCVAANLVNAFPITLLRAVVDHEINLGELVDCVASKVAGHLLSGIDFGRPVAFEGLLRAVKEYLEPYPELFDIFVFEVPVLSLVASVANTVDSLNVNTNGVNLQCQMRPYRFLNLPLDKDDLLSPSPLCAEQLSLHVAVDTPIGCRISPVSMAFQEFLLATPPKPKYSSVFISAETYLNASRSGIIKAKYQTLSPTINN